jgi:DNA helicase HerA-like ATPase
MKSIGQPWSPASYPVELMTISGEKGIKLRATVSEFGPVLFAKMLELNENQQGAIAVIFKYCDDKNWPLLDLKDVRAVLQHLSDRPGKDEASQQYGAVSAATIGVIQRKLLELEQQGGDVFFGERSFEVNDLLRLSADGKGTISILRLTDLQDRPRLFSTFMLCLLAEIYHTFPEMGDSAAPRLAVVVDEAHLVFSEATKTLLQQLESIIKLIRSKGVGIYFCTQLPDDIPENILSQLGLKIQHALRAFTARDRKAIKQAAENFPLTEHYDTDRLLTELGIGEAFVTALDEKGRPTPLVHTLMCAPRSRMDILTAEEQDETVAASALAKKYNETVDRESAYEILKNKLNPAPANEEQHAAPSQSEGSEIVDTIKSIANSSVGRTVVRELTRGLFGVLIGKPSRSNRSHRSGSIF